MHLAQIQTIPEVLSLAKIIILGFMAFVFAMGLTPILSHFLYKYKIGIKIKRNSVSGEKLSYVNKLHSHKEGTPTMGGILIWGTVLVLASIMVLATPLLEAVFDSQWAGRFNFLSRSQTWLPMFALIATAILGLADDFMSVKKIGTNKGGGMRFAVRLTWLLVISAVGAWWFFSKLGWDMLHVPAVGDFSLGLWYIPLFMLVIISMAVSSNETDGLDGLNAGVLAQAFAVFAAIAFFQNKIDLAAFCSVVGGALMAFLWFNFYPARFFMGDTGAVALGATLGVVAMLTNSVLVLPFVVFIYFLESGSVILQMTSKKLFKKKIFLSAPLHHHFEALGWPETKVTVRFWIINAAMALLGLLIGIMGRGG
ncbi:MAG: phospho-N-acetylmuramoyl-pentapeptide-transferase [Candidatus Moranbacteria bacterium]|nr:phospho-N-acetylmuramoyl-pentapeptide-transferase [Candidatus Moranbacteria bacterium]